MDSSLQSLIKRLEQVSEQFHDVHDGIQKAVQLADLDPEMAATRARKVLEYIIRDVYECRINEPPGTRPLDNLIHQLVNEGHFPARLRAYADMVRSLGNTGVHCHKTRLDEVGEQIIAADAYQSLTQLMPILEWYFELKQSGKLSQQEEQRSSSKAAKQAEPATSVRIAIVPKGLHSFGANDADFFLELLPGARDKDGLPESIRFWKGSIEAKKDCEFTVGVIYGPSGCGKTSLVKAGLLPRLAKHVLAVYVEAAPGETEARLLMGLRKRCPELPQSLDLTGSVAAIRQGKGLKTGQKVVLVIDQFEQWLHTKRAELIQALRQCDGERVQCLALVRDDFWVGLSRFMDELHIDLEQGKNMAMVDLFDRPHARKVLTAFGRAFGALKDDLTAEQESFLDQAVEGLAEDGRVISVRLALFAEMTKSKPWAPTTLAEAGGAQGIGVTFLDETFGDRTAHPMLRRHAPAVRAILQAMLPESGADIKGRMRSRQELLEASGYASRARDFDDLLRHLDGEYRLITPTEPSGVDSEQWAGGGESERVDGEQAAGASQTRDKEEKIQSEKRLDDTDRLSTVNHPLPTKFYQLTHDYLVPSLREWLSRKQKETRRGRAELLLADRAAVWSARPENRQLPSLPQWLSINVLTAKKNWTPPQQTMMRRATRFHALRGLSLMILLALLGIGAYETNGRLQARALRDRLLDAHTAEVPAIVKDMAPYRRWINPQLQTALKDAEVKHDARRQLHACLALLPVEPAQRNYLYERLLTADPHEVPILCDALAPHQDELRERLWSVAEQPGRGQESQRLRAAGALALYDPGSRRWENVQDAVVNDLVAVPAVYLANWLDALKPVGDRLLPALAVTFGDGKRREAERLRATEIIAEYAADQPQLLANLLMDANEKQFALLYPKLQNHGDHAVAELQKELKRLPPVEATVGIQDQLAERKANAGVALLGMGRPENVWPLLKAGPDPRVRNHLIHRLALLGSDAAAMAKRLHGENDISIQGALLLTLGEFTDQELAPETRALAIEKARQLYCSAADAGLHAAAEWLLRQRFQHDWLRQQNDEWMNGRLWQEKTLARIRHELIERKVHAAPQWYVNSQGQTLVVLAGPVEFDMGSPPEHAGDRKDETLFRKRIDRSFAVAAKQITMRQYQCFVPDFSPRDIKRYAPDPDCPVMSVTWHDAAAYCNWLSRMDKIDPDQWCYEEKDGKINKKANYLSLTGYRLPTEAEWEYACRSGTTTSRSYGDSAALLAKYAWSSENSSDRTWPAGSLKPNDFGLFDMHGNVWCWCQERYAAYPSQQGGVSPDVEDLEPFRDKENPVLRGGSFYYHFHELRSGFRLEKGVPTTPRNDVGFRVARTFR